MECSTTSPKPQAPKVFAVHLLLRILRPFWLSIRVRRVGVQKAVCLHCRTLPELETVPT